MANKYPILLLDGNCSLCNTSVYLIIRLERRPILRFAALESDLGQALIKKYSNGMEVPDSVVLIDGGRLFTKSEAVMRVGQIAGGMLVLLMLLRLLPTTLANRLYDYVARNRSRWFGQTTYCARINTKDKHRFLDLSAVDVVEYD